MRVQWLQIWVGAATALGVSSQAIAHVFKVTNRDIQTIELAVAYEADEFDGAPASGVRYINGVYIIKPGQTAALFTYKQALNSAWVSVRSGAQRTVWKAEHLPTFDVSANSVVCKPVCAVAGIPGFTGDAAVTTTMYATLMVPGYAPVHLAKIFGAVLGRDAELIWSPSRPAPGPLPVPPAPLPLPLPVPPLPVPPAPLPPVSDGQVRVCNQTDKRLATAIGYFDTTQKAWEAVGWYQLDAGSCTTPLTSHKGAVYGLATDQPASNEGGTRKIPSGSTASFCVSSQGSFTLPFTACQAMKPDVRLEAFGQLVPDAQGHISWNITP